MRLKEIREEKNLTQAEVSRALNISRSTYGMWEQERDIIPVKRLNDICNYFNVSFDYIFNFTTISKYENNMKEINKNIAGKRLKEFRKENSFTQIKLAQELNIGNGTLAGYEIGTYIIATPFLYTLCSKYKISADYLLGKVNNPKYLK